MRTANAVCADPDSWKLDRKLGQWLNLGPQAAVHGLLKVPWEPNFCPPSRGWARNETTFAPSEPERGAQKLLEGADVL